MKKLLLLSTIFAIGTQAICNAADPIDKELQKLVIEVKNENKDCKSSNKASRNKRYNVAHQWIKATLYW